MGDPRFIHPNESGWGHDWTKGRALMHYWIPLWRLDEEHTAICGTIEPAYSGDIRTDDGPRKCKRCLRKRSG